MIGCLDVSYLSNLHCALFGSPALAEYLVRRRPRPAMVYESRHGSTSGLLAPSECGQFWYRFFRKAPQPVAPAEADPRGLHGLRTSVAALQAVARRPVVFKNLICSLRVAAIAAALPEALFIVVHRDLTDNARSLLVARRSVTGSYERWWSAEPPGYETLLGLTPEQQVVGQVLGAAKRPFERTDPAATGVEQAPGQRGRGEDRCLVGGDGDEALGVEGVDDHAAAGLDPRPPDHRRLGVRPGPEDPPAGTQRIEVSLPGQFGQVKVAEAALDPADRRLIGAHVRALPHLVVDVPVDEWPDLHALVGPAGDDHVGSPGGHGVDLLVVAGLDVDTHVKVRRPELVECRS